MLFDEQNLIDKLRKVEALFAGAASDGERNAAANAIERIREHLRQVQSVDPAVEMQFSMADQWSRKLFVALLRRYGIAPYRYNRQRYTTVMARVPKGFVNDTLWPEYQELSKALRHYLDDVTQRVITAGVFADNSEAEVRPESLSLSAPDV
jgi:tRNA nucleotidyltransferase (CCA-adding enzyme)